MTRPILSMIRRFAALLATISMLATVIAWTGAGEIPLEIVEPEERRSQAVEFPVSVGLVFPEGECVSPPGGGLVDDRGADVPFEYEVTGWWPPEKKSLKWLLLHFRAATDRRYVFDPSRRPMSPAGPALASPDAGDVRIVTGPLEARVARGSGSLLQDVKCDGVPCLGSAGVVPSLETDDGPCSIGDWTVTLEDASPARAVVKAGGVYRDSAGATVARLDARLQFFKGESFVRMHHTLTWMVKDTRTGVRELSLQLAVPDGEAGRARIGLSDQGPESVDMALDASSRVLAVQDGPDHFTISGKEGEPITGKRLGGWATLANAAGRGAGVALRHAWQMHPSGMAVDKGGLHVKLWPREAGRMGFDYADIMPPDFFNAAEWKRFPWSKDTGHFEHEYGKNPAYLHTAEGAARTHEMTLFFFGPQSRRTMAELNALTQHPVAIRQDPRSAMRVPFMGFEVTPSDRARYPDVERAVEQIGRMTTARWPQLHDYGWWRFGMIRWAAPGGTLYRWFDGVQYDQQLVPWLLWMRGGGREFFEEAEATTRYAMDVHVNHFNTRNSPTGYMASAGGMPFPWGAFHMHKAMKLHFLAACHHLTGDRRAKEVLEEVIAGAKLAAANDPQKRGVHRGGRGRELYNMITFWGNAWEETGDPDLRALGLEWLDLAASREFNAELAEFRNPPVYLYNGLVIGQRLWNHPASARAMLANLAHYGFPALEDGGVWDVERTIACGWAYDTTKDERFIRVAWDVARGLADLVPDHDWSSPTPPHWPYPGNMHSRTLLGPILAGVSLAAKHGLDMDEPFVRRDTFFSLAVDKPGHFVGEARLRPRADGDLPVRILITTQQQQPAAPVKATALDPTGKEVGQVTLTMKPAEQTPDGYFDPRWWFCEGRMTIAKANLRTTYTLRFDGSGSLAPLVLVLADASVVHRMPEGFIDFYQESGQYHAGVRVFAKTTTDAMQVNNPNRAPFTIRDAKTHELLFRSSTADPQATTHRLGRGRLVLLTQPGYRSPMRLQGVSPWLSATREGWFEPEKKP